jgi:hypothetical protein
MPAHRMNMRCIGTAASNTNGGEVQTGVARETPDERSWSIMTAHFFSRGVNRSAGAAAKLLPKSERSVASVHDVLHRAAQKGPSYAQ